MPERPENRNQKAEQGTPPDFALVGRRVSSWTSKALVSAIILVAGIGFGRQVIQWWTPPESPSSRPIGATHLGEGLGDLDQPHEIRFGRCPWTLRRQMITGSREKAIRALQALSQQATLEAALPPEKRGEQEKRFLASLDGQEPIAQEPGAWRLYALDGMVPMAAGIRIQAPHSGEGLAERGGRVVAWGMAFPVAEHSWSVLTFRATGAVSESRPKGEPIPLPPGGRPVLALRAVEGASVEVFRGDIEPHACRAFYDGWFRRHGGKPLGPWRSWGKQWTRQFELPPGRMVGVQLTMGSQSENPAVSPLGTENGKGILSSSRTRERTDRLQGLLVISDESNKSD